MGDVINFPLPKDPRERAKRLMKLAKQEKREPARRANLFNQATAILKELRHKDVS